jgi:hypothetical protein
VIWKSIYVRAHKQDSNSDARAYTDRADLPPCGDRAKEPPRARDRLSSPWMMVMMMMMYSPAKHKTRHPQCPSSRAAAAAGDGPSGRGSRAGKRPSSSGAVARSSSSRHDRQQQQQRRLELLDLRQPEAAQQPAVHAPADRRFAEVDPLDALRSSSREQTRNDAKGRAASKIDKSDG